MTWDAPVKAAGDRWLYDQYNAMVAYIKALPTTNAFPADRFVFKIGTTYYVLNGLTGATTTYASASLAIQAAYTGLTGGRVHKERVVILGDMTITATITGPPNYSITDIYGRLVSGPLLNADMFQNSGNHTFDFNVFGEFNGAKASQTVANILVNIYNCYDFTLKLNQLRDSKGSGCVLNTCRDFQILNAFLYGCDESNLRFQEETYDGQISNIISLNSGQCGINFMGGATGCHDLQFTNIIARNNTHHGIVFGGRVAHMPSFKIDFSNVTSIGNYQSGICIDNGHDIGIHGGSIENNGRGLDADVSTRCGVHMQDGGEPAYGCYNILIDGLRDWDTQTPTTQLWAVRSIESSDNVKVKNCLMVHNKTGGVSLVGTHNEVDYHIDVQYDLDLSGAGMDVWAWHSNRHCQLVGYFLTYTEASSGDAGVEVRVGKYADGVGLDGDYFDASTSEISKGLGYRKYFATSDLTNILIDEGDIVTVGIAGGKVGTGTIRPTLLIADYVAIA